MLVKSSRITFLGTPEFKAALEERARSEGISVGELVRRQFEDKPSEEEIMLQALCKELQVTVAEAKVALDEGLSEVQAALAESRIGSDQEAS